MSLPKLSAPLFSVTIPSTQNQVKIRPMLVKEEKILLIAKESEDTTDQLTAIKQVVGNCLIDCDVNSLTIFDIEYIFLKIRGVSISNVVKASFKDNEDEKVYDFNIDLDKDITINKDNMKSSSITFSNEGNNFEMILKYPSSTLYDDKGFLKSEGDKVFDKLIYKCLDKITMNQIPLDISNEEEFIEWINQLPVKVYEQIQEYFRNQPTLYCKLKYTNSNGKEREIILTTLSDFFTFR